MNPKQLALEFVELVKVDRVGREYRESMPRWLAEVALGRIPAEEPEIIYAYIEPIELARLSFYPAIRTTGHPIWQIAFILAYYLPTRLVD